MNRKGIFLLFALLLCSLSAQSFASCTFSNSTGYMTATKSFTMPISGTLSVPPNTTVGQEIYRQNISLTNQSIAYINCTSAGQYYYNFKYLTTPTTPSTYSSMVYNTDIPGIGIKFTTTTYSAGDFPATVATPNCTGSTSCGWASGYTAASWFSLIKTAENISPGVLSASSLPSVAYALGQRGAMVDIYKISLSGSLQITAPTCNISPASQSMTVNMGSHDVDVFTGIGTGTEWKNASIQLTNCGLFYGNSQGGNTMATFNGSTVAYQSLNNNYLTITLTPLNGMEDAANGVMKIDDHPLKAFGVGIQLAKSESASDLVNLASNMTQALPKDGTPSITVPLYARYIQTENSVLPGKANGRLEYTITYQ
jgi:major type 1 subunit fimbrin (pilin)